MSSYYKDVKGYEGLYLVGRGGEIVSLPRHGTRYNEPVELKGSYDNHGYKQVTLCKDGNGLSVKVHRIVATAFIHNPLRLREVNHKDENKDNNSADNLEWCTREYNVRYGRRTQKTRKKVNQFTKDGKYIRTFSGVTEAAKEIGGNKNISNISNCCNRKRNTAYGYKWGWAE